MQFVSIKYLSSKTKILHMMTCISFHNSEKNAKSFIVIDAFQTIHSPPLFNKVFYKQPSNGITDISLFIFLPD